MDVCKFRSTVVSTCLDANDNTSKLLLKRPI